LLLLCAGTVHAESKLKVELAWGTDGEKPLGKELTALDPKAREKLRHLRWKNYWVVKSESPSVTSREARKVPLDRCLLEMKKVDGGQQLEVKVHTVTEKEPPKLLKTVHHSMDALRRGEFLVIAGDAKDRWDDGWFVIIRSAE
jgi:hypothetical protein